MSPESQHASSDYDVKAYELPQGAIFLPQCDNAYFFVSDKCHLAFNVRALLHPYTSPQEHLELILKVNLQHKCVTASRFGGTVALATGNHLYVVDSSGSLYEKKFKKRSLYVYMLNEHDLLRVVICRHRKALQVVLGEHTSTLELYTGQCSFEVIFASMVDTNMFCMVYVNSSKAVRIVLIAILDGHLSLVRNDCFCEAQSAKMFRALRNKNLYLIEYDGKRSILTYDTLHCSMVLVKHLTFVPSEGATLMLLDANQVLQCSVDRGSLRLVCSDLSKKHHSESAISFGGKKAKIISVKSRGQDISLLLMSDENRVSLVQCRLPDPCIDIFCDNTQLLKKSEGELTELIRKGTIPINSQLVDHICHKKLKTCAIECLQSSYISETHAVRLVISDMTLLKVLIEHTKGDQHGMVEAIRQQVSTTKCAEMIQQLLEMLDNLDIFATRQLHCYKRIIALLNILMDAMLFELHEAKLLKQEWIDRLQALTQHCKTENHNLQSFLSFTNSLLKRRVGKEENDKSSLIVVLPFTV
ncbi:glycosyl transferase, putative [Babesia ovis]|uniref:Glycosyl transferase, putative n=1 Tax=Babesia ovis TaxID=5869 RepID=A0A9W5TAT8_BABOV|nr:glycosyl transferase, putative [Babesia ovis]